MQVSSPYCARMDGSDRPFYGTQLRQFRDASGLQLKEVRERSGLSVATIGNVETGRRKASLDSLQALAATYGKRVVIDFEDASSPSEAVRVPADRASVLRYLLSLSGDQLELVYKLARGLPEVEDELSQRMLVRQVEEMWAMVSEKFKVEAG